jgi:uncharacterized protein (TIGR00661 family)
MKILYGIQGTGNGHISRSTEIIKRLNQVAQVDILISGSLHEMDVGLNVKFRKDGTGAWFKKDGGIDYWGFIRKTKFIKSIKDILFSPVKQYDLVVSDFEPLTAWSAKCYGVPSIHLSHQIALLDNHIPRPPRKDVLAELVIKYFAPCERRIGLHYQRYSENALTPIIRSDVRKLTVSNFDHFVVYFSTYDPLKVGRFFKGVDAKFELFSKYYKFNSPTTKYNVTVYPFRRELFLNRLSSCRGIICNAGFQLTSEALFLGKRMLVIPMKGQYEQICNAEALKQLGATVVTAIDESFGDKLRMWLETTAEQQKMDYPDNGAEVVDKILGRIH